jgi:hypothetical protein
VTSAGADFSVDLLREIVARALGVEAPRRQHRVEGGAFRTLRRIVLLACLAAGALPASALGADYSPGAPGIGDPYFPLEGNGGYDVQHYDLAFS